MSKAYNSHKPQGTQPKPAQRSRAVAKPKAQPEAAKPDRDAKATKVKEIGGPAGPEPTRYGDWEIKGRCVDF